MKIQVDVKNFSVKFDKVEKDLKALNSSYEGYVSDQDHVFFNFTDELDSNQQASIHNYWDGLVESYFDLTDEEIKKIQQKTQREWGFPYAQDLVDTVGARNLILAEQGPVDVAAVLTALGGIKTMLETGALKTAYGVLNLQQPNFPQYDDIFSDAKTTIQGFLVSKGYW